MNRLLKLLVVIIGAILVILFAGYLIIRTYLTPQRVSSIAEKVVSEAIQYPVEIGRVGLHFGFKVGITIDSVRISNVKGFSQKPMIEIEKTTLNLKILPLLQRRIVIGGLDFYGIKVRVERDKLKRTNFAAVIPKEAKGSSWALSLSSISISKGDLYYLDEITKTELSLKDIDQQIRFKGHKVSASGKSTVYILKNNVLPEMIVQVANEITYDTLQKDVEVKKITAVYDPIELTVIGDIGRMENLDIDAKLKVDDMSKLLPLIPAGSRPEKLSGALIVNCSATGKITKINLAGNSEFKNVSFIPKGLIRGFTKIQGSLSFSDKAIKDIELEGAFGKTKLQLTGAVNNISNPLFNLKAKATGDLDDLEMLTNDMKGVQLRGPLAIDLAIKGSGKNPSYAGDYSIKNGFIDGIGLAKPISDFVIQGKFENNAANISKCGGSIGNSDFSLTGKIINFTKPVIEIKNISHFIDLDEIIPKPDKNKQKSKQGALITLRGSTKIDRFIGADMEFKNINTNFTFENAIIDLKNCTADAFDGKVQFDLYYNANSPEPYRINTRMTSISAKKILKRFLNFDNLEGSLSGISNFQGHGFTKNDVLTNLSSSGNIKITKGVFKNFQFFTKLLAWLGLKTYEVVDFNDFVVNFNIDRGKAKVNDWALSSKVGDFLLNGTIGLNGSVNMDIATTLSKEHSNIVKKYHGDWIFPIDSKARATIDIKVSGSFTSPNFSLDKNKIKERIKGKVKNEFENKKKEWEAKIKNLLNK